MRRRTAAAAVLLAAGTVFLGALPTGWPHTAGVSAYDAMLARYVVRGGVEYDGLARDRGGLDAFLRELASIDSTALRARPHREQEAVWINAYNALTLDLVLRNLNGPDGKEPRLKSIRDIPEAFSRPRWVVAGARRSLDGIEKGILLARFHDPRIHFALVCASRSCPALRPRAYTGDSLGAELDHAARAFLADKSRNDVRVWSGAIRLSKIFEWYKEDFVGATRLLTPPLFPAYDPNTGQLLTYLVGSHYLPDETDQAVRKLRSGGVRVEFLPYDWSLNDAPSRR